MYCNMYFMKKIMILIFTFLLSASLWAQSADVITDILDTEEVTLGQVCYLTAVQLDYTDESSSYENAVSVMQEKGLLASSKNENQNAESAVSAVEVAYLFSKLWTVKGGVMYRITKGSPRYVFKQFQCDGVIKSTVDPSSHISGTEALSIYTACVNTYSDFNMSSVSMEEM